jgi:protein-S-isoprenylcysteine O-methyltransferase Ste14
MVRTVVGVVMILLGGLWISQGTGAVQGSMMSGHGQYTALGVVVVLLGVACVLWGWRSRGSKRDGAAPEE